MPALRLDCERRYISHASPGQGVNFVEDAATGDAGDAFAEIFFHSLIWGAGTVGLSRPARGGASRPEAVGPLPTCLLSLLHCSLSQGDPALAFVPMLINEHHPKLGLDHTLKRRQPSP